MVTSHRMHAPRSALYVTPSGWLGSGRTRSPISLEHRAGITVFLVAGSDLLTGDSETAQRRSARQHQRPLPHVGGRAGWGPNADKYLRTGIRSRLNTNGRQEGYFGGDEAQHASLA